MPNGNAIIPREETAPTVNWVAENAEITAADTAYESVALDAKKAAARVIISNELLNDAPNLGEAVERSIVQQIRATADAAFLSGDGASDNPTGIVNQSGIQSKDLSTSALTIDELVLGYYAIRGVSPDGRIAALMNADAMQALDSAREDSTSGGYLTASAPEAYRDLRRILATAIETSAGTPDTTTVILGNFADAVIGIVNGMAVQLDPYSLSSHDQTIVRVTYRVDFGLYRPQSFYVLLNAGL
jgi:HK97 family phage major capsid protein